MKPAFITNRGVTTIRFGIAALLALLTLLSAILLIYGRHTDRLKSNYEHLVEKTRLVQTMRSELLASAEAEKSAVMADTDEASNAFSDQSEQSSQNVEKARLALQALIEKDSGEAKSLDEFTSSWEKLRQVDRQILSLAVQNTNLKALRLSIGPAAEALKRLQAALDQLMDWAADPAIHDTGILRLAAAALADSLNLHALETPHITEATDAGMGAIEAKMKPLDERVRQALNRLDALVKGAGKPLLGEAWSAFGEFQTLHKEVIDLSHRNTNIRSFAESLGQKRQMMTLCLSQLKALQEVVKENATFKATR